jgi:exodeoxyribonuclease V gamma subunit
MEVSLEHAMTELRIFSSNRLELLAEKLAQLLREPLRSPLEPELVVVQSKGMERWISMELARSHGVCANMRFPFPNTFLEDVFHRLVRPLPDRSPFEPQVLSWRVMGLLPSLVESPAFTTLRGYLGDPPDALKLIQLSERIADTYDQYLLFRPEMILEWEQGSESHWQARLWRELSRGREHLHRAALGRALLEALQTSHLEVGHFPERVSVFGISALPRFHLEVLAALSRVTRVNLFLMNPCREYWGDIVAHREARRARAGTDSSTDELHLETGNTLLASLGALGRDFFDLLTEYAGEEEATFLDPGEGTLLSALQSDILNLRDRGRAGEGRSAIAAADASIQIHSCHSPMREVEVLHDRLCRLFEEDPDLAAGDILIMTPDIGTYAPFIQAVFAAPGKAAGMIPFTIADRSVREEGEIVTAFLAILDLWGSRFTSSEVLALLEARAVRSRAGLSEADVEVVRRWVRKTGVRWGIDDRNRRELALPAYRENTWRAGLDRLLLGYALPGEEERLFGGVLPYDEIEGGDALVLGRFLEFVEKLFREVQSVGRPRTLLEWSRVLREILDHFFEMDEEGERELQVMRRQIKEFADLQELAQLSGPVELKAVRYHLGHHLEREGFGFGFMTGAVTFCALLPMRSIPFKVIWLLGMNGDAYPRQAPPLGFDLMARHPRRGDRSRRNDDRYLFLEGLLSARGHLAISYVGQSIQDNSLLPPSVVVSELQDYIEQGFELPGGDILEHVVTRHRLQGFSPGYFTGDQRLFSYSAEYFETAKGLVAPRRAALPFIPAGLTEPPAEWRTVVLDELVLFFANPARFLLTKRLGIRLDGEEQVLPESEPFTLTGLERYLLGERLVARGLAGQDLRAYLPLARAAGRLPHGIVGECTYEELRIGVERFVARSRPYLESAQPEPLPVDLTLGDFRLTGRIGGRYGDRLVQQRYARVRPQDQIRTWISHLALGLADSPRSSMLVSLRAEGEAAWVAWDYGPVEKGGEILAGLLERYWEGLRRPLHFFPRSSWAYARLVLEREGAEGEALRKASAAWAGDDYRRGESEDPYYHLCFRDTDPLGDEFRRLARELFEPLLAHQKEVG